MANSLQPEYRVVYREQEKQLEDTTDNGLWGGSTRNG